MTNISPCLLYFSPQQGGFILGEVLTLPTKEVVWVCHDSLTLPGNMTKVEHCQAFVLLPPLEKLIKETP